MAGDANPAPLQEAGGPAAGEEREPPAEAPPPVPESAATIVEPSQEAEDPRPKEADPPAAQAPARQDGGALAPTLEKAPASPGSASKKKSRDTAAVAGAAEGGEISVALPAKTPLDLKHERLSGVVAKYTASNGWGMLKSHMFEGELLFRADRIMPEFQGHPINEGDNMEFDVQADDHGRPHAVAMKPMLGRRPNDCLGQRHRGYVRRFAERWGFLNAAAFDGDLFVHRDNLLPVPDQTGDGQPPLRAGQAVEFDVALDDRGRAVAKQITTRALLRPCDWISHRLRGYIRSFQGAWGFINSDRFAGDLFVHRDSLMAQCQNSALTVGTIVEFDVERDHHRKGAKNRLVARHVAVISAGEAAATEQPPPAYGTLPPPHQLPGAVPLPPQSPIHMDPAVAAAYGGAPPPQPFTGSYGAMNPQAPSFAPSHPMYYAQAAPPAVGLSPEQHQQLAAYGAAQYPCSPQYPYQPQLPPPLQPMPPPQYGQSPYGTMPQYGQSPYGAMPQYGVPPPQPGLPLPQPQPQPQPQGTLPPLSPQQQQQQQQQLSPLATAGIPAPLVRPQAQPQLPQSPEEQQRALQAAQQAAVIQQPRMPSQQPQPQAAPMQQMHQPQAEGIMGAATLATPGAGPGAVPVSGEGTSQGLLHITMHDWEPDQPGQLWVAKGTLVSVSYRAAHGWVYAGTVQPGSESGEPASEGWVPQAVVKRVSLCRVSLDWPDEGAGTLGVSRGEIVAVSKEAERGWVFGERIGPRHPDRPSDGWLPKKVLDYLQS